MLNNLVLVGRIASDLEIEETESGAKVLTMVLAIQRQYKNQDGIYETDFIPVKVLAGQMQDTAVEYCRKGDIVGVKGRLQSNGGQVIVVAEKVTFLTTRKEEE